ncbi:hypothetical protein PsorP6_004325 [Peronosclerospora sorghi]|uniref:Uncharacterized protein n=1 Tax=Peronosclerospora sorghi TaxID=230839 RepID=A0ACC0VLW6_9STRA|nr:hypothetical protein PsorP6_004325 [Peronosclerospora sorghi]
MEELHCSVPTFGFDLDRTRVVLQFFKEHENLQGPMSNPVFPIFISSSEIYTMKVPRKRRIYDVLHVLEGMEITAQYILVKAADMIDTYTHIGIGVIKRARCDEARRSKSGYFLYYGKAASVQHLAEIKNLSAKTMVEFRQSRYPKWTSVVEEDSAIVKVFENQAVVEKWPCLVTTTVCFLGLLFQQDYQAGMSLPAVSSRLIEAKKYIGGLKPSSPWIETPYNDVHRRVYDVTSILVSCNMINTSFGSSCDPSDNYFPRKYARFNYNIFTDPTVLFATRELGSQWRIGPTCESNSGVMGVKSPGVKNSVPRYTNNPLISTPLASWKRTNAGTALKIPPIFPSLVGGMSDASKSETANQGSFKYDEATKIALQCGIEPWKCRPDGPSEPHVQDLFSPLSKEMIKCDEWFDESLNQLGIHDTDKFEWDLNWQVKDACSEDWGIHASAATTAIPRSNGIGAYQF